MLRIHKAEKPKLIKIRYLVYGISFCDGLSSFLVSWYAILMHRSGGRVEQRPDSEAGEDASASSRLVGSGIF